MKHLAQMILILATSTMAQDYYPLAISNKWSYVYSTHPVYPNPGTATYDTVDVSVVADTLVFDGHTYYTLSKSDFMGGRYVRTDSTGIHYFDELGRRDIFAFPTTVAIDDTVHFQWQTMSIVRLADIDTVDILGVSTRVLTFKIDGLLVQEVKFSDKFGPVRSDFYGDPAPMFPVAVHRLVGCRIDSLSYGTVTSIRTPRDFPEKFFLDQNFPNPFNSSTQIRFSSEFSGEYLLSITNLLGQAVWSQSGFVERGESAMVSWNVVESSGPSVPTGVYFLRLTISDKTLTRRMLLLR